MNISEQTKIDLHMHTTASDGTDSPEGIAMKVKKAGIGLFAVTDHDAVLGCRKVRAVRKEGDPLFINGVEFSCQDEGGKYHILGYGYDINAAAINAAVEKTHGFRMIKARGRLEFLSSAFGFEFSGGDVNDLLSLNNPGKPHIGNLMVKYGYAPTKEIAITEYINKKKFKNIYLHPQEAITAILESGGIPILAHPAYGSGDELILGDDMDKRIRHLMDFGILGMEAYYSGFTPKIQQEMLFLAEKYGLYVTAGSDYHGENKMVLLGHTNLPCIGEGPEGLHRFLERVLDGNTDSNA